MSISMPEISEDIAKAAGKLRGRYAFLKTGDAIHLFLALDIGADAFLTSDTKLNQIKKPKVLVLRDDL